MEDLNTDKYYIGAASSPEKWDIKPGIELYNYSDAVKAMKYWSLDLIAKKVNGGYLFESYDPGFLESEWYSPTLRKSDRKELPHMEAERIIKQHNIIRLGTGKALYVYKDNYYQFCSKDDIERIIFNRDKSRSQRAIKEIRGCIELDNDIAYENVDKGYICFTNGLLRLSDMELVEHTPNIICTTRIEHKWLKELPKRYMSSAIMKSVYTWTKNDDKDVDNNDLATLLLEMCGCCFTYDVTMQKAFVISGNKSNGKSAFMQFLQFCLGDNNYSSVDMSELNDRFTKIEIMGKLANISDDIADNYLNNKVESMFKKFVTGDTIMGEFKGENVVKFNPYATFIYTCNDIPKAADPKGALARRLIYFPFLHTFDEKDKDMHIYEKLNTEKCAEIFIHLAIKAYVKAKSRGCYTASEETRALATKHTTESSSVLMWANTTREELDLDAECFRAWLVGKEVSEIYSEYYEWALRNGYKHPPTVQSFSSQIQIRYNICTKKAPVKNDQNKRPQIFEKITKK